MWHLGPGTHSLMPGSRPSKPGSGSLRQHCAFHGPRGCLTSYTQQRNEELASMYHNRTPLINCMLNLSCLLGHPQLRPSPRLELPGSPCQQAWPAERLWSLQVPWCWHRCFVPSKASPDALEPRASCPGHLSSGAGAGDLKLLRLLVGAGWCCGARGRVVGEQRGQEWGWIQKQRTASCIEPWSSERRRQDTAAVQRFSLC